MTEEGAKTKWCPMVRYVPGGAGNPPAMGTTGPANYVAGRDASWRAKCIASDCMMWRQTKPKEWIKGAGRRKGTWSDAEGFCGLAGPDQ